MARAAGTLRKFLLALGHPTLRLRGREVTALQSAINGADKILGIRAIRVRKEVQRRVVLYRAVETRRSLIVFCGNLSRPGGSEYRTRGRELRRVSVLDRRC